jgi:hypothetical protein
MLVRNPDPEFGGAAQVLPPAARVSTDTSPTGTESMAVTESAAAQNPEVTHETLVRLPPAVPGGSCVDCRVKWLRLPRQAAVVPVLVWSP